MKITLAISILFLLNRLLWGQIAAWDFTGLNNVASATATTFNSNLVSGSGAKNITRGSSATASVAANSFRTTGFKNEGISTSNTDYFQVTISATTGYKVSLSTIDAKFGGTASYYAVPGVTSQFAYSLNGSTFTLIGSPVQTTSLTMTQIALSGIPALQNVVAGTTITIRYYASGQTTTGGWGFLSAASAGTNGLAIGGTVNPITTTAVQLTNGIASTPLTGGYINKAIIGYSLTSEGNPNFTAINVQTSSTTLGKFNNIKIYKSTDNDYSTSGDNAQVLGLTINQTSTEIQISGFSETLSGTPTNFFVVTDIDLTVTGATPNVQPSFTEANITVSEGTVSAVTVTGTDYAFQPTAILLAATESGTLNYTEGDGAILLTSTTTVTAVEANLVSGVIQITNNYQNGEDLLGFTNQNGITGSWDATTGTLTLFGTTSVINYQTAIRSITYQNTSFNPNILQRTVSFTINDGTVNSNTVTRNISVTAVSFVPALTGIEVPNLAYTEMESAKQITGSTNVSDADNTTMSNANIQIVANYFNGQDILLFTNQNGITGTWTAAAGTLSLSGVSSVANYQTALRDVKYNNTSDNPSTLTRTVSFTVNDGDNNSNTETRNINVMAVNDAPVLATIEVAALSYTEGDAATSITSTITVSDVDDTNIESATVQITGNYQNGQDVLSFTNQNGITGTWTVGTGTMAFSGSATITNYQTALRDAKYNNTNDNPSTLTRTVSFTINDGDNNSNTETKELKVTAVNDTPVLATIEIAALSYIENDVATAVTSTITVSDVDNTNIESATIQITGNYQNGQDVLSFTNQNGITGTWTAGTGTMAFSGSATIANYQRALRDVKYNNTSDDPSMLPRTVSFTVNDGDNNSNTETRNINVTAVNDAPVLATTELAALSYTEGDAATAVTSIITVSDVNDTNIESATIQITDNYQNGEDLLSFTNQNGITGSWTVISGTMALSGSATKANYQTALREVKYNNTSDAPSTLVRTVNFTISDGETNSNSSTRQIIITAVNDAPMLATIEVAALNYAENDVAKAVTSTITVSGVDDTNIESATIQITDNYQNDQDVLSFTNQNGITGTWTAATGTMVLCGSATIANYQTALRDVKYKNISNAPDTSARTVSFTINDGDNNSNTQTRNINISVADDASVLTAIEVAASSYTEGDAATAITSTIEVTDEDDANIESATIQITTNYSNGEDILSFTNQYGITGTWTAATGTLSLNGVSSVANYQIAIGSVLYLNNSQNPNTSVRTVSFVVNDGELNSNTVTRNINVVAVNNPPEIKSLEDSQLVFLAGSQAVTITQTISLNDIDNENLVSAEIKIFTHYQNGNDVLSFTNTNGIIGIWNASNGTMILTGVSSKANYRAALRSVTYRHIDGVNSNLYVRTICFKVNDGESDSYVVSREINLGNTPPVLAGVESIPLEYKQGGNPAIITNGLTITGNGIPNLQYAVVKITNNYKNGEDVLSFQNKNGIIGTWYPSQGVLILNLASSLSNYEVALRSVTYNNINSSPSTLTRTVSFIVSDPYQESNVVIRTLNITPIYTVDLMSNPLNAGTINGGGSFDPGNSVTVTATPNMGYTFLNWTEGGNVVSSSPSYTFIINSNRTLTANFNITQCTVITNPNSDEGGTTSEGGTFNYGSSVSVTATASSGYSFVNWTSEGTEVSTSSTYTFMITNNLNLVANFMMLPILTVVPEFLHVGPIAGTASVNVYNTGDGTMNWIALSDVLWIKITSDANGTNNGIINLSYDQNNGDSRVGTITITAEGVTGSPKSVEIIQDAAITYVNNLNLGIPEKYFLEQNYPNPFNPTTKIRYGLPKGSNVIVTVYDVLGSEITRLVNDFQNEGFYEVNFNASNLANGIYIYRISAGSFIQYKKMLLIK